MRGLPKSEMKICLVSPTEKGGYGGGFVSTRILAKALEERGYDIHFAYSYKEIAKDSDIVLHQNIKYLIQTQKFCERKNLHLVVTVNSFISCCTGTHVINKTKYGSSCYKCNLWKAFNCFLWNKRNRYPSTKERLKALTVIPRFYNLKRRIKALNKVDKVICISPTMRKMLGINGVKEEKMEVIPQPVDSSFLEDPGVRLFDERVALFTSGTSWIKGAHLATEAISKISEIKLVFTGSINKSDPIFGQISNSLGDRAIFVGVVPAEEMKKYYYSAHVVLFPSIWFEAFGRVWAEACMCGKPVVAFKGRGGASDYLKHEETALLSDYDVDEYAEQIKRSFEDEALYKKISRNAREYAKKNFLADVDAKKYEKVFKEVLEGK